MDFFHCRATVQLSLFEDMNQFCELGFDFLGLIAVISFIVHEFTFTLFSDAIVSK